MTRENLTQIDQHARNLTYSLSSRHGTIIDGMQHAVDENDWQAFRTLSRLLRDIDGLAA